MAIVVEGFLELEKGLDDMQISDKKKKDVLYKAGDYARVKVTEATYKRTGMLRRSWKLRYQRIDGNLAIRLYSGVRHDIYNEFGSSNNKAHIGFFSNTIDRETDRVVKIMVDGVMK